MTDKSAAPDGASARTILLSLLGALVAAAVILFAFVLPAETGFDPLRTGRLLGLTALADPPSPALAVQSEGLRSDEVSFTLRPFEGIEYKYQLAEGAGAAFSWSADAPVYYDMHAEPEGAEEGYAESFATGTADRQSGVYVAPFPGIHGWFWENRGAEPVTVRLESTGFYTGAITFDAYGAHPKDIPAAE